MQLLTWKLQFNRAKQVRVNVSLATSRIQVYALVKDGLIDPSAWQPGCVQSLRESTGYRFIDTHVCMYIYIHVYIYMYFHINFYIHTQT